MFFRTALPTRSSALLHRKSCPPAVHRVELRTLQGSGRVKQTFVGCSGVATTIDRQSKELDYEEDAFGRLRLKYKPEGWNFWTWRGRRVHYITEGQQGPPVVLVHGYGASAYHWRYNISALAQKHRVYAVDLMGFGWSEKAVDVNYNNGSVWVDQLTDFIKEVVGGEPAVLVGNSLGGYASLATAAANPDLVRGLALLNSAGPMTDPGTPPPPPAADSVFTPIKEALVGLVQRAVLYVAFLKAREPDRIRQVLNMVYASGDSVDDELVSSIEAPAQDPQASQVFFLINNRKGAPVTVNSLLARLPRNFPLLLLWGELDPWIVPARADKMQVLYPSAVRVNVRAGHCPHDDSPQETNSSLMAWLEGISAAQALSIKV